MNRRRESWQILNSVKIPFAAAHRYPVPNTAAHLAKALATLSSSTAIAVMRSVPAISSGEDYRNPLEGERRHGAFFLSLCNANCQFAYALNGIQVSSKLTSCFKRSSFPTSETPPLVSARLPHPRA